MGFMLKLMPNFNKLRSSKFEVLTLQFKKGFTLIELLVTISIIGILASLTLASYSAAQQKARDGIRKNDLAQVKRALELAKADCTSSAYYPYKTGADIKAAYTALSTFMGQGSTANSYMSPVPTDPKNDSTYFYGYTPGANVVTAVCPPDTSGGANNTGTADYTLTATIERINDADGLKSYQRCGGGTAGAKPGLPTTGGDASYTAGKYYACNN